jgi:hypothetical protein
MVVRRIMVVMSMIAQSRRVWRSIRVLILVPLSSSVLQQLAKPETQWSVGKVDMFRLLNTGLVGLRTGELLRWRERRERAVPREWWGAARSDVACRREGLRRLGGGVATDETLPTFSDDVGLAAAVTVTAGHRVISFELFSTEDGSEIWLTERFPF